MFIPEETEIDPILLGQVLDIEINLPADVVDDVDLPNAVIEFDLSTSPTDPPFDSLPSTDNGTDQITGTLSTPKCLEIGPGRHYFSCWVTNVGGSTPVALGWITIMDSTRG